MFLIGAALLLGAWGADAVSDFHLRRHVPRPLMMSINHGPLDIPLALLAGGLAVLAGVIVGLWAGRAAWFRALFPGRRAVALILLQALFLFPLKNGAVPTSLFVTLTSVGFLFWATAIRPGERGRLWTWAERLGQMPDRIFLPLIGGLALALNLAVALGLYRQTVYVLDEGIYLFQARIFAHGRLYAPPPGPEDFFYLPNLIQTSIMWMSHHPPGWPALLALGVKAGGPWLVNPVLGALLVLIVSRLGREIFDRSVGRLAAVLSLLSPFVLSMNGSLMSHPATALFLNGALLAFLRWKETRRLHWALALGLGLGSAAVVRPYTAFLFSLPLAAFTAFLWLKERGRPSGGVIMMLLGLAAPLAGFLAFNQAVFGNALTFGYQLSHGTVPLLGFGARYYPEPFTPVEAVRILFMRLTMLSRLLWAFPLPPFFFIALPLAFERKPLSLLLLSIPGILFLGHMYYFFLEESFPPRFVFECWPVLLVLAARGILLVHEQIKAIHLPIQAQLQRAALWAAGFALLVNLPLHAPLYVKAEEGGPALKEAMKEAADRRLLVFIQHGFYLQGISLMDPVELDQGPLFVRDLGPEKNRWLVEAHPDRKPYCFFKPDLFSSPRLESCPEGMMPGEQGRDSFSP